MIICSLCSYMSTCSLQANQRRIVAETFHFIFIRQHKKVTQKKHKYLKCILFFDIKSWQFFCTSLFRDVGGSVGFRQRGSVSGALWVWSRCRLHLSALHGWLLTPLRLAWSRRHTSRQQQLQRRTLASNASTVQHFATYHPVCIIQTEWKYSELAGSLLNGSANVPIHWVPRTYGRTDGRIARQSDECNEMYIPIIATPVLEQLSPPSLIVSCSDIRQ